MPVFCEFWVLQLSQLPLMPALAHMSPRMILHATVLFNDTLASYYGEYIGRFEAPSGISQGLRDQPPGHWGLLQ